MGDKTTIEWTDATWNPTVGCAVVSPGCTNCYAMKMAARIEAMQAGTHYVGTTRRVNGNAVWTGKLAAAPDRILTQPLRWKRPRRIFVNSMSDLFHDDVPDETIDKVFAVMALAPQHTLQVLTKRAERTRAWFAERWQPTLAHRYVFPGGDSIDVPADPEGEDREDQVREACEPLLQQFNLADTTRNELWTEDGSCKAMQWNWPLPNVWLGVSVEDQTRADERIPPLLQTPAAVRFVSCEPLLGPVDLEEWLCDAHPTQEQVDGPRGLHGAPRIDWVIAGGESGPCARPMHPDWARSLRDQCARAGVPFFFKQWGAWGTTCFHMGTGAPVFRQFKTFDQWVNKANTWVNGGTCIDTAGNILKRGADFMAARDGNRFPVAVVHKLGKAAAGRLLDGVEHTAWPEASP